MLAIALVSDFRPDVEWIASRFGDKAPHLTRRDATMRLLVLAVWLLLVGCEPMATATQITATDQAIVGGTVDFEDPQVFQLMIQGIPTGRGSCSATLIGARTLLTAAHCVDPLRFGASSLAMMATNKTHAATAQPSDFITVVDARRHPEWSFPSPNNDIALALLEKAPTIAPKRLNFASVTRFGGKPLRAVGYGMTGPDDGGSGIKRQVHLTFRQLTATQIRIGDQLSKGICSGDSGGPSFHLFADGVERVVGVHSTSSVTDSCLDGTDQRVDVHAAFIRAWLVEKETAACGDDGQCVPTGCPELDLDCQCEADGLCTDKCSHLQYDPDCPADCVENGVCSVGPCPIPDVDCGNFSGACSKPEDCLGARCVTDPQHERAYCSAACTLNPECPATMFCDATRTCRYQQLPIAHQGAPCAAGKQLCEPGAICLVSTQSPGTCVEPCVKDSDCTDNRMCVGDAAFSRSCQRPVELPTPREASPSALWGCATTRPEGLSVWVSVWLAGTGRARKRKTQ